MASGTETMAMVSVCNRRDDRMNIVMLKSKLHQACVTDSDIAYEGSFGIDGELMQAVGLVSYEKILISNINNGQRFETYAIAEPSGSRRMVLNGAAARLGAAGDRVIIMAFCSVDEAEVHSGRFRSRVLRLDEHNEPAGPMPVATSEQDVAMMVD